MTEVVFVHQKTDRGPLATIKLEFPSGLAPNLFNPCATLAEFESALDKVERDFKKAREDAREWFSGRKSN